MWCAGGYGGHYGRCAGARPSQEGGRGWRQEVGGSAWGLEHCVVCHLPAGVPSQASYVQCTACAGLILAGGGGERGVIVPAHTLQQSTRKREDWAPSLALWKQDVLTESGRHTVGTTWSTRHGRSCGQQRRQGDGVHRRRVVHSRTPHNLPRIHQ